MKKLIVLFLSMMSLFIMTSCTNINASYCLYIASGSIYSRGTQEVYISFNEQYGETSEFLDDISVKDIFFYGDLYRKEVLEVSKESETVIKVKITGDCPDTLTTQSGVEVNARAIRMNVTCRANIKEIAKPKAYAITKTSLSNLGSKSGSFTSVLAMPIGEFNSDALASGITFNDSTDNVEILYNSENGYLSVTVKNYYYTEDKPLPVVKFASSTNTLNYEFEIEIGRSLI